MTAKVLMEAIGDIDESYIMEFADVKEQKVRKIDVFKKFLAIAASVVLVVLTSMVVGKIMNPSVVPPTIDREQVVWRQGNMSQYGEEFDFSKLVTGNIYIGDSLADAFWNFPAEETVFAVSISEETGASKEEVYEQFVKQLGVAEEYMESGVIFATKEQIEGFSCPADMLILLRHAYKEKTTISVEMKNVQNPYPTLSDELYAIINWQITNSSSEKIPVSISYIDNYDAKKIEEMAYELANVDEEERHLSELEKCDKVARARTELNKQHIQQALEKFVIETGISESDIERVCSLIPLISLAWLTPEQLLELADSPLVGRIEYVDVDAVVVPYG